MINSLEGGAATCGLLSSKIGVLAEVEVRRMP